MPQPVWRFVANLGDESFVDYGGLFLFEDETGVYGFELEKLDEPPDDDRCSVCEDEPDAETSEELERLRRKQSREYEGWLDDHPFASVAECGVAEESIRIRWIGPIEAEKARIAEAHAEWTTHVAKHERWEVRRVCLDRFKIVREAEHDCQCVHVCADDVEHEAWWKAHERVCPSRKVFRYLVDYAYEESWRRHGTPSEREPWFYDSLGDIASYSGTTRFALIRALCSADGKDLAWAWQSILDYHGWDNGDSDPLRLSRPEVEARYKDIQEL